MDVVYLCREGENNEELRYSLRSLRFTPHEQVWIFGGAPSWVNRDLVRVVPVPQAEFNFRNAWLVKYQNVRRNLSTAVETTGVAERFLLMNDDFYLTEEIQTVPVLNYGTKAQFDAYYMKRRGAVPTQYVLGEWATLAWLEEIGIVNPLSYALHVPLPVDRDVMGHVLADLPELLDGQPVHLRTAYGNIAEIGGLTVSDVKVERGQKGSTRRMNGQRIGPVPVRPELPKPFASSSDRSFVSEQFPIGKWIRQLHPEPSLYER